MLFNRSLLDQIRSKFDENISDEVKFRPLEDVIFVATVRSRSAAGSIDCKSHEKFVFKKNPKLTEIMR